MAAVSRTLRTVAIIAGAVALVAVTAGAAAGALAPAMAGATTVAGVSTGTIATIGAIASVASTVASYAAQATAKKPPARGSVNQVLIASDAPSPYLMGRTFFGGVLRHDVGYGPTLKKVPNPYRGMVLLYSVCGPLQGLEAPYLDFAPVTINSGGEAVGYYNGFLNFDYRVGNDPDSALIPHYSGMPGWSSNHKLSSKACALWNLKFDKDGKRFASGVPSMGAVWNGVKVYDPRLDSTYPGGSGPQRINNEATWTFSENPGLHGLAYSLGRYRNSKKVFGIGMPPAGIAVEHFVAMANVCDANGWKVGGIIYEPGDRWNNLKDILQAGGAEPGFVGGRLGLKINAPRVALDTITAVDLADDDAETTAMQSWRNRRNGIIPKYRSEENKWDYVPSDLVTIPAYVAEDGEEKNEERQYNLVQQKNQAAQLAAYELVNGRELSPIVLVCKPRLRKYGMGDMLTINLPGDHGLANVDAVIIDRSVDPATMKVTLTLTSETAGKHDFALGRTGTAPPTPSLTSPGDRDDVITAVDAPRYEDGTFIDDLRPAEPGATSGATPSESALLAQLDADTAAAQASIAAAQGNIASIFQEIDDLDDALANISLTVTQAGGNLAPNSDFAVDTAGWNFGQNGTSHSAARDLLGDAYRPANEHVLGLYQSNDNAADYALWVSSRIAVAANSWQEFSAWVANARCNVKLLLRFYPANGGPLVDWYSETTSVEHMGNSLDSYQRLFVKRQMPSAGTVELFFIKDGTTPGASDSFAWLLRPQIVETTADTASPVRYYPGSAAAVVRQQATAIAGVQAQGASLQATLSVAGAEIDDLQSVAVTTTGKVAQIETRLRAGSPNLLKNGGLSNGLANSGHDGTFFWQSNAWGPQAISTTNGTRVYNFDAVPAIPGEPFTIHCDPIAFGAGSWTYMDMLFQDAGGNVVPGGDSPENIVYGIYDFQPTTERRALIAVSAVAPAGTAKVVARFVANCANGGPVGFRQAKLERASTWSAFSDEATVQQVWSAYSGLNSQYASISTTVAVQGVTVSEQAVAISTQQGQITTLFGRWAAVIDVAGYVTSLEANNNGSYSAWKFRTNEVAIEDPGGGGFQLRDGRIRITAGGGFMKVVGDGFGSSGQFIDWYGPFFANLANCTEANAISYQTVDGRAYHGGGLSSGILKNENTSTTQSPTASIVVGPFSSNGDTININFGAGYSWKQLCTASTGSISGSGGGTLTLEYLAGSTWIALTATGVNETVRTVRVDGDPSVQDVIEWEMRATATYSWTPGVSTNLVLRAIWSGFSTPNFLGSSLQSPIIQQSTTVIAVEV